MLHLLALALFPGCSCCLQQNTTVLPLPRYVAAPPTFPSPLTQIPPQGPSTLGLSRYADNTTFMPLDLPPNPDEGPLESTYLQLFLLKYMCPVPGCFGTLAPLMTTGAGAAAEGGAPDEGVHECNVCGGRRSEAQFLQELEQGI